MDADGSTHANRSPEGFPAEGAARATRIGHALRNPVVVVLGVAGIVDIATGDPALHGIALMAVALILIRDGLSRRTAAPAAVTEPEAASAMAGSGARPSREGFRFTAPIVATGIVYAIVVGTFDRFSWPLTVAVAVPGVWAVSIAWRAGERGSTAPPLEPVGRAVWLAVFLLLAAWEVQALLLQPTLTTSSWAHPTLSTLMDPILAGHLGRSITLVAWLAVGGHLLGLEP